MKCLKDPGENQEVTEEVAAAPEPNADNPADVGVDEGVGALVD